MYVCACVCVRVHVPSAMDVMIKVAATKMRCLFIATVCMCVYMYVCMHM